MSNIEKFAKKISDDIAKTKFSVYKSYATNKMISSIPQLKTGESSALFQRATPKGKEQLIEISSNFRDVMKELFSSMNNSFKMTMARMVEASEENILKARKNFGRYLEKTLNDAVQKIFADVVQDQIIDKYEKKYRTIKHGKAIDLMLKSLKDTVAIMTANINKYLKVKINLKEDTARSFKENGAEYTVNDLYSIDIEFKLFDMAIEKAAEKQNNVLSLYERKAGKATFPNASYYDKRKGKLRYRTKKTQTVYNLSALEEIRHTWKVSRAKYSMLTIVDLGTKGQYEIKPYGKPTYEKETTSGIKSRRFGAKEFESKTGKVSIKIKSKKKYLINHFKDGYLFQRRAYRSKGTSGSNIIFEAQNLINKKIEIEFIKRIGEFVKENYGQIKDDMLEWLTKTSSFKKVEIKRKASKQARVNMLKGIVTRNKTL